MPRKLTAPTVGSLYCVTVSEPGSFDPTDRHFVVATGMTAAMDAFAGRFPDAAVINCSVVAYESNVLVDLDIATRH